MNLYELTDAYKNISEMIENGEDLDEVLATIDEEIEQKADNYAKVIRNMEGSIAAIKEEKKRLSDRQKAMEDGIAKMKENLQASMIACKKKKFKTDLFSFNIQKNGGKAPVIVDVECSKLPDDLVIVTEKPDLDAIRKLIEENGDITYGHLGERGESLRIK